LDFQTRGEAKTEENEDTFESGEDEQMSRMMIMMMMMRNIE